MSAGTNYVIERLGIELAKADQNVQTLLEHKGNLDQQVAGLQSEVTMLREQLAEKQAAPPALEATYAESPLDPADET